MPHLAEVWLIKGSLSTVTYILPFLLTTLFILILEAECRRSIKHLTALRIPFSSTFSGGAGAAVFDINLTSQHTTRAHPSLFFCGPVLPRLFEPTITTSFGKARSVLYLVNQALIKRDRSSDSRCLSQQSHTRLPPMHHASASSSSPVCLSLATRPHLVHQASSSGPSLPSPLLLSSGRHVTSYRVFHESFASPPA